MLIIFMMVPEKEEGICNVKKRIGIILAATLIFGVGAGTSYAYLTAQDDVQNVFQASGTEIVVEEEFTPVQEVTPGLVIAKAPRVISRSSTSCYVRMRVCFSDEQAKNRCHPLEINSGWTEKEDGFYYWKEPLLPGQSTGTLFDRVTIRSDVPQTELEAFDIQVYAEAVQSQGRSEEAAWKIMN